MKIRVAPSPGLGGGEFFDLQLSSELTKRLKSDDVDGILKALADAGLSPDHLSYSLTPESETEGSKKNIFCSKNNPASSQSVSFNTITHLCMLMQCTRVFKYIASEQPHLLMVPDDCGSGLLHSLAMANVLLQTSSNNQDRKSELSDGFEKFQTEVFHILKDTECSHSLLPSASSVLHSLCLMENSCSLRPVEFSILIGAYSTFRCILNVRGYILTKQVSHGVRVRSTYNLEEYDLMRGERRDKNPMYMLTLISTDQADSLLKSGLLEAPVVKKWMNIVAREMISATSIHKCVIVLFCLIFTPISYGFETPASMILFGYQLHSGFLEFSHFVKSQVNFTSGNISSIESSVRQYCKPENLVVFLMADENPKNGEILVRSPIFFTLITRAKIIANALSVQLIVGIFLSIRLIVIAYNLVKTWHFRSTPWMPKRKTKLLIRTHFFDVAYILSFLSGLMYIVASTQFQSYMDCSNNVLGLTSGNKQLSILANVAECAAVLYFFFNLFLLFEAYELIAKPVAFLNICFRQMLTNFLYVIPLLLLWAYLVFGTLFYMTDTEGIEFKTNMHIFYTPLRFMVNLANPPHDLCSIILHTLFVLIVIFGIQSFIIAFISNAFNEVAANFEQIYALCNLSNWLHTWRLYPGLARLCKCRCFGGSCCNNGNPFVFRVWSLKLPSESDAPSLS